MLPPYFALNSDNVAVCILQLQMCDYDSKIYTIFSLFSRSLERMEYN